MSWNPDIVRVTRSPQLARYSDRDVLEIIAQTNLEIENKQKELEGLAPENPEWLGKKVTITCSASCNKETTACKIQALETIKTSLFEMAQNLDEATQDFKSYAAQVKELTDSIFSINATCDAYLYNYQELLKQQRD